MESSVQAASNAQQVRDYARREYIEPARHRKQATVRIVAGDVARALKLNQRVANVCQALSGASFLQANHLAIEKREGPPSGQGTRVTFTYRLLDHSKDRTDAEESISFLDLIGAGKEVFDSLGGGEAFIRSLRNDSLSKGRER
jgi:hypothetical protein